MPKPRGYDLHLRCRKNCPPKPKMVQMVTKIDTRNRSCAIILGEPLSLFSSAKPVTRVFLLTSICLFLFCTTIVGLPSSLAFSFIPTAYAAAAPAKDSDQTTSGKKPTSNSLSPPITATGNPSQTTSGALSSDSKDQELVKKMFKDTQYEDFEEQPRVRPFHIPGGEQ
jgi:hypothetical protein